MINKQTYGDNNEIFQIAKVKLQLMEAIPPRLTLIAYADIIS